jgi:teichuronic acid biosynthesis glycosyltransferase TuaG
VLDQDHRPLEVLVCDNGSSDDTAARFLEWQDRRGDVRYLRTTTNSGTPATTRNLGIEHARGDWIAFLDDDDTWLPGKLARQQTIITSGVADVIATNALCSDGDVYFAGASPLQTPTRNDLLKRNPIITSSAVVRRSLAGFPTAVWMSGIEDYAAWLALADRGARFAVLGEPLVLYNDAGSERLSAARASRQMAMARLAWQRAMRRPLESSGFASALRSTAGVAHVALGDWLAAVRQRDQ